MKRIIILLYVIVCCSMLHAREETALSYSARQCILPEQPFDYEFRYQHSKELAEGETSNFIALYEREVGIHGWGIESYTTLPIHIAVSGTYLKFSTEWYVRQVKKLDYEGLAVTYPFMAYGIAWGTGFSLMASDWEDLKCMFTLVAQYRDLLEFDYKIHSENEIIINQVLHKRFYADDKTQTGLFFEPRAEHKNINGQTDWWVKVIIGYVLP